MKLLIAAAFFAVSLFGQCRPQDNVGAAAITVTSSAGPIEIISVKGFSYSVCHLSAQWSSSQTVKLVYGTGTNCGSGTTDLTGTYAAGTSLNINPSLPVPANVALCIQFGGSTTAGGVVTYARR